MVKCRDLDKVVIHKNLYKPKSTYKTKKSVIALDTETENGLVFILGIYTNNHKEVYRIKSFNDFINVISKLSHLSLIFFYNITYDYQAIIKLLPKHIEFITNYDFYEDDEVYFKYINNKCLDLTIKKTNKNYKFFDLAQFYNHKPLNDLGIKYFKIGKDNIKDYGIDISKLSAYRYDNDKNYKMILDKYLIQDCYITFMLGEKLRDMCINTLNIYPKHLYSQASIFQQKCLEVIKRQYKIPDLKIIQFAMNCYNGGRFETIKKGYIENVTIQDINSAYPNEMYKLPALDTGKWISDTNYNEHSLISLYKCSFILNNNDLKISPMKFDKYKKVNGLFYPIGKFDNVYLNKKEFECIKEYTPIIINKAFHYIEDNPEYPFYFVKGEYDKRIELKNNNDENEHIIKIEINGGYGKTIQLNPVITDIEVKIGEEDIINKKFTDDEIEDIYTYNGKLYYRIRKGFKSGQLFNPIYANEITANTRCKIFNSVKNNMVDVVAFATDSITYEGNKITKKLDIDKIKLGYWDTEYKGDIIYLGSGVYHKIETDKSKLRGFDTKLNLYELLKLNGDKKYIGMNIKKLIKMKYLNKVVDTKDLPFKNDKLSNLNMFADFYKKVNLNFDNKRVWDRKFINCNDVLKSKIDSKAIYI